MKSINKSSNLKVHFLKEDVYVRKPTRARVQYRDDYCTWYCFTFIRVFLFSPHSVTTPSWIDKNYVCATRSSLPGGRFHDATASFCTGMRISLRYKIRPGWTPSCMARSVMTVSRDWTKVNSVRKSPRDYVNTPLVFVFVAFYGYFFNVRVRSLRTDQMILKETHFRLVTLALESTRITF